MYEIRKFKLINFALVWMYVAVANYLIFGILYGVFFAVIGGLFSGGSILDEFGSFGVIGGGFLFGILVVALLGFLGGLLTAAIYNLISLKMNRGLQLDIAQIVEKEVKE